MDLIILDVNMPQMNGFETLEHIREQSSAPAIFLTADEGTDVREKGEALGVSHYVAKPFVPQEFRTVIAEILNHD